MALVVHIVTDVCSHSTNIQHIHHNQQSFEKAGSMFTLSADIGIWDVGAEVHGRLSQFHRSTLKFPLNQLNRLHNVYTVHPLPPNLNLFPAGNIYPSLALHTCFSSYLLREC